MADVCAIGAGPAGSTFAARMVQLGHHVLLIERLPRMQPGESLSPGRLVKHGILVGKALNGGAPP
jgi:flavin-dependent dehydrogenase